jgi:hypothetical protein
MYFFLPPIPDYSCAIQKDILVHGRLYVSQNYLCFHANIIVYETKLTLKWKDVTSISKLFLCILLSTFFTYSTNFQIGFHLIFFFLRE